MELTIHGADRVFDRTRMMLDDVLEMLRQNGAVSLGSTRENEFLLFYSPTDRTYKIAVTSIGKKHLISVWEKDFRLPYGITRVDPRAMHAARVALSAFMFKRFRESYRDTPIVQTPPPIVSAVPAEVPLLPFTAFVEVRDSAKTIYMHEAGEVLRERAEKFDWVLDTLAPSLKEITSIVEKHHDKVEGVIVYRIMLADPNRPGKARHFYIGHQKLLKRI